MGRSSGLAFAHLVEVDVHALELELGGAIVAVMGGELSRSSPDRVISGTKLRTHRRRRGRARQR